MVTKSLPSGPVTSIAVTGTSAVLLFRSDVEPGKSMNFSDTFEGTANGAPPIRDCLGTEVEKGWCVSGRANAGARKVGNAWVRPVSRRSWLPSCLDSAQGIPSFHFR